MKSDLMTPREVGDFGALGAKPVLHLQLGAWLSRILKSTGFLAKLEAVEKTEDVVELSCSTEKSFG